VLAYVLCEVKVECVLEKKNTLYFHVIGDLEIFMNLFINGVCQGSVWWLHFILNGLFTEVYFQ